jgi:Kef-type K+ transport system membrane component KefB/nucleotide-binding universal stress UspA family protein
MELLSQILVGKITSHFLSQEVFVPITLVLLVIVVVPILFERLKLPGLVGLVGAGLVLGPSGWNLISSQSPVITLLSDIGLVYLLFIAGIEFDFPLFRQYQSRALGLGICNFCLSLISATLVGRIFGFDWTIAVLIGCLITAYTPLSHPILNRLGVLNNEAIIVATSAKTVTDIGTLLTLSLCLILAHAGTLSVTKILDLCGWMIIYSLAILVGLERAGNNFFRRYGDDESHQFFFIALALFSANVLAQFMGIDKFLAVFLVGLLINKSAITAAVQEKLVLVGSLLFIPVFFVHLGLMVNLSSLVNNFSTINLLLLLLASLICSKLLAAVLVKLVYRYNWQETWTIWSLSLPVVGVTLAVASAGMKAGLLPPQIFSMAIALVLITSIFGTWLTSWLAVGLTGSGLLEASSSNLSESQLPTEILPLTIAVPVGHVQVQQYLIELAASLAMQTQGKIIPLAIATATAQMDQPQLEASWQRSEQLLAKATAQSQLLGVPAEPLLRIDSSLAMGISRAAREQKASLIITDWGKQSNWMPRLFGKEVDNLLWSSHCPVAVVHLVESPKRIQRILVPIKNLITPRLKPLEFAEILADANQCHITLLNVCVSLTSASEIALRRSLLSELVAQLGLSNQPEIQVIPHEDITQAILQAARLYDLVVMPFQRHRPAPAGIVLSDITTQLARQLTCSMVVIGEPQKYRRAIVSSRTTSHKLLNI